MKKGLLLVLFLYIGIHISSSQTFQKVQYSKADSIVTNPERGFMHFAEIWSSLPYSFFDLGTLQSYRTQNITLVNWNIYLDAFKTGDISPEFLANMATDFQTLRTAGIKTVLRFAYTTNTTFPIGDAPINIVLRHIQQLKLLLQQNSDVIFTLQAGFIGAWGEWYYTQYYADPSDSANWNLRVQIVNAEMDALPKNRMIQLRTPGYIYTLAMDTVPIQPQEAYTGTLKARMGFHDDCFVADQSDEGTFTNMPFDWNYSSKSTKYMVVGGETCQVNLPYSACANTITDLIDMHWTFLNIDYNTSVLLDWQNNGCMPEIWKNLGFNYQLLNATVQDSSKEGGAFSAIINLINNGYSNPVNPRPVELILRNRSTKAEYYVNFNQDIRLMPLNDTITFSFNCGLPSNIPNGKYDLYLNLPDPEYRLYGNPLYSIRMTNDNIWESTSGYNKLMDSLIISNKANSNLYTGNDTFLLKNSGKISSQANPLQANIFNNNVNLYWGQNAGNYYQTITRSQGNGQATSLATLYPGIISYQDYNLSPNTNYSYKINLVAQDSGSNSTDSIIVNTGNNGTYYIQIHDNGSIGDWSAVPPVAAVYHNDTTSNIRFTNTLDTLFIYTQYLKKPNIYISTDSTGIALKSFPNNIFSYKISNDSLYNVNNGRWTLSKIISYQAGNDSAQYAVSLKDLPVFATKTNFYTGIITPTENLMDSTVISVQMVPYPAIPSELVVQNNPNVLYSLYISWNNAINATSYILERSNGNKDNFAYDMTVPVAENTGVHLDLKVKEDSIYYYTVYSTQGFYRSANSDTVSGVPGVTAVNVKSYETAQIFPNPVSKSGELTISLSESSTYSLEIYNMLGTEVGHIKFNNSQYHLNPSSLGIQNGVYLIRVIDESNNQCILQNKLIVI